jgi:NADPH:quinone reductase-like Zn-dependent oxidoreductase
MHAAVLQVLGKPPRFEEFPEPTPGSGEVLIHVCAAALKPVDKQLAGGKHFASPRELPVVCGGDGVGRLEDGTRMFFGGPRRPYGAMAERALWCGERNVFRSLRMWTTTRPRPFPILVYLPGFRSSTARSWPRAKPC